MLYVIFDLDKTSLYCPIADKLDKFIPQNKFLKRLYYCLYPIVHTLELLFGLFKTNRNMYLRARYYQDEPNVTTVVLTARHKSRMVFKHVKETFKDAVPNFVCCVGQGITGLSKAKYLSLVFDFNKNDELIMFDDNQEELDEMTYYFGDNFSGVLTNFDGEKEETFIC